MKSLKYILVLVVLVGFAYIGCSDKMQSPNSPAAGSDNSAASLSKTTGPGAWIFLYEAETAFAYYDAQTGLLLTLGVSDANAICSGTDGAEIFNVKDILLPNEDEDPALRRVVTKMFGKDITAMVWECATPPSSTCSFITANDPLAVGTVKYLSTDNDYYATFQDNKNTNSYGTKANGTLTGSGGEVYKLNFTYHATWDGSDFNSLKERTNIHLVLTGKN